jgi:hypothetical protein
MQTDESRNLIHTLMVNLSGMQGEAKRLRQKQVRSLIRRASRRVYRGEASAFVILSEAKNLGLVTERLP